MEECPFPLEEAWPFEDMRICLVGEGDTPPIPGDRHALLAMGSGERRGGDRVPPRERFRPNLLNVFNMKVIP